MRRAEKRCIDCVKEHGIPLGKVEHKDFEIELFECSCFLGKILIQMYRDPKDSIYYDFAKYQIHSKAALIVPVTWAIGSVQVLAERVLSIAEIQYEVNSSRKYGEPKLVKPKELKNIKSIGSAEFIHKKCNPQIFVNGNDVWVKHTDYFSSVWQPPAGERIDMPQNYYLEKYFNSEKSKKLIYENNWGSIILKNEVWLVLRNAVPVFQSDVASNADIIRMIMESQTSTERGLSLYDRTWEDFWGKVVALVQQGKQS